MTISIKQVKVSELKPAAYNPRKWSEKATRELNDSIESFGLVDPIICNNAHGRENVVIGGHFRLHVAKQLGYAEVPVVDKEKELNQKYQSSLFVLTTTTINGIIKPLCEKIFSFVNNVAKSLSAKKLVRVERLFSVLDNVTENLSLTSKNAYAVVSNFIITEINISAQWSVQGNISRAKNFPNPIANLFHWLVKGDSVSRSIINGKVMTWGTEHCTNGYIAYWVHQWSASIAEAKNQIINKFTGLIRAANIGASKVIGFACVFNVIRSTIWGVQHNLVDIFNNAINRVMSFHRSVFSFGDIVLDLFGGSGSTLMHATTSTGAGTPWSSTRSMLT